jgi:hypothetical protein
VTTARVSLPAGTMAVPAARNFTSATMYAWDVPDRTREIAELVVSELVGNGVEHGGGIVEFALSLVDGVVRVDVVDNSPDLPVAMSPEPVDARHRGLLIVAALSTRWGSLRMGPGKSVWAELPSADSGANGPPVLDDDVAPALTGGDDRSLSG